MARIEFKNLGHAYAARGQTQDANRADTTARKLADYALQPMSMEWQDGGAYALLGPSGCGKSTLLNIISGLLVPSEGQVLFNGVDVTRTPTRERNIAQVFQFPVLYDTMSVFDNLAFPLRNRKMPEAKVKARVHEVAEMLDLSADLNIRASGLAADAKQKISLGRGLVRQDVAAILFDEPLTVIDPHMKWQLRQKLKQIHQQLKITMIYVTHDQVEALTFADEVVVMTNGKVVQKGHPEALFEQPDHSFVGFFIGSPGMNFYPLTLDGDAIALGEQRLQVSGDTLRSLKSVQGELKLGIRPEFVELASPGSAGSVAANVVRIQNLGTCQLVTALFGEQVIKARIDTAQDVVLGPQALRLLQPQTIFFCNDERIGR
jgi:glycerol transport system ATP-binding protein